MTYDPLMEWYDRYVGTAESLDLSDPADRAKFAERRARRLGGYGPPEHPEKRRERMALLTDTRPAHVLVGLLREEYLRGDMEVDEFERRVEWVMWRARHWDEELP